jgi:hypothetical protein
MPDGVQQSHAMPRSDHHRRLRSRAIVATALALLAAACGSSSNHSSGSTPPKDLATAAFKFSACMRDHGITNFPDPKVSSSGGSSGSGATRIAMVVPATFAKSPHFAAASRACRGILPAPGGGNPVSIAAALQARKKYLLAFAQCLRAHGVPNFPDPTAQGQLTLEMIHSAGVDLQAPAVLPAGRACVGVTHGVITWADVERAVNGGQ